MEVTRQPAGDVGIAATRRALKVFRARADAPSVAAAAPFIALLRYLPRTVRKVFLMARSATLTRPSLPLGSLTQRGARVATCTSCSSERVTQLSMNLTDGTPVDFVSCHVCAHRSWWHEDVELSVSDVLARTRKQR
jgi:hypothetical protein